MHAAPYRALHAIDLKSEKTLWNRPLGTPPAAPDERTTGMVNLVGPIVTASGLVIGASPDGSLRPFDRRDGAALWKSKLPGGLRDADDLCRP